jgi:glycine/D-amino acid oxidase-like deaminating enzyme
MWARLGWAGRETWRDGAHVYAYAQRTADDRIAIGGRGVPYRFGSRLDRRGGTPPLTAGRLAATLLRLLPACAEAPVAHVWSGVLGVARDWCPAVGTIRHGPGGLAWAGGYVGDGVATSHLAGRTLADLVLGRETELTTLPWVGHTSRGWEPEPLRWLGVRSVYGLYRAADRAEARHPGRRRTSGWARLADLVSGRP